MVPVGLGAAMVAELLRGDTPTPTASDSVGQRRSSKFRSVCGAMVEIKTPITPQPEDEGYFIYFYLTMIPWRNIFKMLII